MEVTNVGLMTKKHIGKGSIALSSAITAVNEPLQVVIELTHESSKGNVKQGLVRMRLLLAGNVELPIVKQIAEKKPEQVTEPQENKPTEQPNNTNQSVSHQSKLIESGMAFPQDTTSASLLIEGIAVNHLHDSGWLMDKQDPAVFISFGKFLLETAR